MTSALGSIGQRAYELLFPEPVDNPWEHEARPEQLPPEGDWLVWLILAGRGWGKTRTGAEWLADRALNEPGDWAIVAPTYSDVRDVCVEGSRSGLLSVLKNREQQPKTYNRSLGELRFDNGSRIKLLSADEPERARGWNFSGAWADELASWRYPAMWHETLVPAVRMGTHPQFVVTTTPKPVPLMRYLYERVGEEPERFRLTRGRTRDNYPNLAPGFVDELERRYAGTRIGRQEVEGELLEDIEGALWTRAMIDDLRVAPGFEVGYAGGLKRVVVGVDPAITSGEESDETGIVVAGTARDDTGFVLDDYSCRLSPDGWAKEAIRAYHDWEADVLVAEANQGGDMVRHVLSTVDPTVPVTLVHASRGKRTRAEPIAALYEQRKVRHVGAFPDLEDQMVSWTPDVAQSPDRMDALVWALTEVMLDAIGAGVGKYRNRVRTRER